MRTDFCPCQSGRRYGDCCGPLLAGRREAVTAEQLMRSRYTAFARGDREYLLRTWDPATRPASVEIDPSLRWRRLQVLECIDGEPGDTEGRVRFAAHYRRAGDRGTLAELSSFRRLQGRWVYVDGVIG